MNIKGAFYIILFIIVVGIAGVYQANISQSISPNVFIFFSSFAALIYFSSICFIHNQFVFIKKSFSQQKNILLLNVSTFMGWFFYMFALKYLEPAICVLILNAIGPFFVIVFSKYLRPQSQIFKIEKIAAAGIFISLIYILYITLNGKSALQSASASDLQIGILFSILAGAGQVLFTIYSKKLSDASFSNSEILALRFPLLCIVSFFLLEKSQVISVFTNLNIGLNTLGLSIIGMVLPIYFYQKGIKLIEPIFIAILMILEPIFILLFQLFDPRLNISIFSYIGVGLIALFSLLSVLGRYYNTQSLKH